MMVERKKRTRLHAMIRRAYAAGMTQAEIAQAVGLTRQRVSQLLMEG